MKANRNESGEGMGVVWMIFVCFLGIRLLCFIACAFIKTSSYFTLFFFLLASPSFRPRSSSFDPLLWPPIFLTRRKKKCGTAWRQRRRWRLSFRSKSFACDNSPQVAEETRPLAVRRTGGEDDDDSAEGRKPRSFFRDAPPPTFIPSALYSAFPILSHFHGRCCSSPGETSSALFFVFVFVLIHAALARASCGATAVIR